MAVVNMATCENITTAMKKSLGDVGLDLQQCLSFSTDNASVMTGRHKGVLGLLHQENPQIYGIGCACHLSALARSMVVRLSNISTQRILLLVMFSPVAIFTTGISMNEVVTSPV
jgi:CO dehydrogenase nickel-insertion accessory protein CooC1